MQISVHNTIVSVITVLLEIRLVDSLAVVSTSILRTFSVAISFLDFLVGRGRSRERRGSDILVRHSIDMATVITGSEESIELDLPVECTTCNGTGAKMARLRNV